MPTLKRCRGLHTFNNELNEPEGALDVADNVVIDRDDTIEPRRGFDDFGGEAANSINQIFEYKGRIFRHHNNTVDFDSTGLGNFTSLTGTFSETESNLRIKAEEAKGNLFFTTNSGVQKISANNTSQLSTNNVRLAGGPKAVDLSAELKPTTGGFLPPQSKVGYRLVWGVRDNNNVLILGTPSSRFVLSNTAKDQTFNEQFIIDFSDPSDASAGDLDGKYILFSSENTDYFLWFDGLGGTTQPSTSETIARTPIEADISGASGTQEITNIAANALSSVISGEYEITVGTKTITMTSKEVGADITNAAEQSVDSSGSSTSVTNLSITTEVEGNTLTASSSNATLNFTIPSDVDSTDFFYQIYRTAPATVTEGLDLTDIDPGDEMNLVLEDNITSSELTAGEVTVDDITTESLRAGGAFLYTNPNTGQGILQANDRPPIGKDLALFRGSMFYSNTRTAHRYTTNLLSVSSFTSGVSKLIIGNENIVREYTFVGEEEVTDIVTDSYANTTGGTYFLINSAQNERKYYVWLDKGADTDPAISDRIGIRVRIFNGDTASTVASRVETAIEAATTDFNISTSSSTITITNEKNGNTDDASIVGLGGSWSATVTTQGDGEDASNNDVLLSSLVSVGQSIDETARSLVRVINNDSSSPVNAFYLTGPDDLPGIILLENRTLDDIEFFVGVNESIMTDKFNPELPLENSITNISVADPTQITSTLHGLTTGDEIFIYNTDSTPSPQGKFEITVVDANNFTIDFEVTSSGSTGNWFKANQNSDAEVSPNRLYFSKVEQPEAVPSVNFIDIGPKDKAIKRIISLRDNLFVLKEDGIYIVTGTSSPNFGSRLLDSSAKVVAADSAAVLNNKIYVLSSQGVVSITESGISIISRPIENLILGFANSRFNNYSNISFGIASETDRSYFLWAPTDTTDTVGTQCFRYNTFTRTWTRWTLNATAGVINPKDDKIYLSSGDRNYIIQERKSLDRTDHADRSFNLSIISEGVDGSVLTISSAIDLKIGDAVVQNQYVTISQYNRLLQKLDIDPGLDDTDYNSSLQAIPGDNMKTKLDDLNSKLVSDDSSGIITSQIFSTDFETQQTQYNDMIDELNNNSSDAFFTNYNQSTGTVPYETSIDLVNSSSSEVTVEDELPFIIGPITVYSGIQTDIQWVPQDFGAPDILKQVSEGTIIFDQNNFRDASVGYATDLSQNFKFIDFTGRGIGDWGFFNWGETTWGGRGSEVPLRTYIPQQKQRCRFIKVRFKHNNARELYRVIGISLEPRVMSKRAYR